MSTTLSLHDPALESESAVPKTDESLRNRVAQLENELALYHDVLERVINVTSEAAQGNLEARLIGCEDSELLGGVAHSINHLLDMTDAFLREAGASLEHASHGKFFRRVLLRGMRGTFRHKSQLINEATEKMARNAASLKEVERLVSDSAEIAQGAARESTEAISIVKRLGEASERIGSVVHSISQIAWQTKLLAFNAKIEASRAGEAGRGFEVVAQEVKELAQQTATATDSISREISSVRQEIGHTADAISTMSGTIGQMETISTTIQKAVAEQNRKKSADEI